MNLRQLRYFIEVAHSGSQTAAAQRLNISQPALGLQIRELEADLNVQLFYRRSRGMELSPAGEELLGRAEHLFEELEDTRQAMRRFAQRTRRVLNLGTPPTPGKLLVPTLLRALASQDTFRLALHEGLSSDLVTHIKSGDLDLALSYDPPPDESRLSVALAHDDLILVGPPGELGGGQRPIGFHSLGQFPMVMDSPKQITRRLLDTLAHQENVTLQVVLEVDSVNLKREVLLSQDCFAIVPRGLFQEAIAEDRFDWAPITDPCITRTLYLTARRNLPVEDFDLILNTLTPIVRDYIGHKDVNWRQP